MTHLSVKTGSEQGSYKKSTRIIVFTVSESLDILKYQTVDFRINEYQEVSFWHIRDFMTHNKTISILEFHETIKLPQNILT